MGGVPEMGDLRHHFLGLHDISRHARQRASVLEAAKVHAEVALPTRRPRRPGFIPAGEMPKDGRRQQGVPPNCQGEAKEQPSYLTKLGNCSLRQQMLRILRSSFAGWKDLLFANERQQRQQLQEAGFACHQAMSKAQAALLTSVVLSGWRCYASRSQSVWRFSQVSARSWAHHVDQKALAVIVHSWLALATTKASKHAAKDEVHSTLRGLDACLMRTTLLLWASASAHQAAARQLSHKKVLQTVWHKWRAVTTVQARHHRPKLLVATTQAWLREDRQVQRSALVSWRAVVLATEYTRDLRMLQCRLSTAVSHADRLAHSQQDLGLWALLMHAVLSWRALALQMSKDRLRRSHADAPSTKASRQPKRRQSFSSDFSLQRQVFFAWHQTMQVSLFADGHGESAFQDERGLLHSELMRLKEESKHRAIDLLEVMALSREAAALTGSVRKMHLFVLEGAHVCPNQRHWAAQHL
ncbi:unnamed protein product [Symbiodinium natans]|uniref:Sfi1 spindle body domain-containing protein n=1 Tax=Symbiodinium natans TaxID=878477 RepID=A0A812JIX2_9DINO|nr:unnamed protein product [Symbiodinium natans]